MNVSTIIGNLTRDPELKALPSGTEVCELTVAVNERGKDGKEYVSFLDVVTFGVTAQNCGRYLTKGRQVAVTGRLRQERWETPEGQKRSRVKIVAQFVDFIGPKTEAAHKDDGLDAAREFIAGPADADDDIPF